MGLKEGSLRNVSTGVYEIPDIQDNFNYLSYGESINGQQNWTVSSGTVEGGDGSDGQDSQFDSTIYLRYTGGAQATKSVEAAPYGTVSFAQSLDGSKDYIGSEVKLGNSTDGLIFRSKMTDTGGSNEGKWEVNGTRFQTGITDGQWYELSFSLDWDAETVEVSEGGIVQGTVAFLNSTAEADEVEVSSGGTEHVGTLENLTLGK